MPRKIPDKKIKEFEKAKKELLKEVYNSKNFDELKTNLMVVFVGISVIEDILRNYIKNSKDDKKCQEKYQK